MDIVIDLITSGKVAGFAGEKPEVIVTLISRVFIFRKNRRALKIYRRDNSYWNIHFSDLSGGELRKEFIKQDFEWNNYFNPAVYLKLSEASLDGNEVVFSELKDGDELVIEMDLIDTSHFLIPLLASKKTNLTKGDFFSIGEQFAELKHGFKQKPDFNKNWFEIFGGRIADIKIWMETFPAISKNVVSECVNFLENYADVNRERFESVGRNEMVATIDAHGENAIYSAKRLSFIDIFLPKELWRLAPKEIDILRIGLDIYVLGGREAYLSYLEGIKSKTSFDNRDEEFYLLYVSALMVCIQLTIAENNKNRQPVAEKYLSFFEELLRRLG